MVIEVHHISHIAALRLLKACCKVVNNNFNSYVVKIPSRLIRLYTDIKVSYVNDKDHDHQCAPGARLLDCE